MKFCKIMLPEESLNILQNKNKEMRKCMSFMTILVHTVMYPIEKSLTKADFHIIKKYLSRVASTNLFSFMISLIRTLERATDSKCSWQFLSWVLSIN